MMHRILWSNSLLRHQFFRVGIMLGETGGGDGCALLNLRGVFLVQGEELSPFHDSDVLRAPRGEFGEFFPARHGGVLTEAEVGGNAEGGSGRITASQALRFPFRGLAPGRPFPPRADNHAKRSSTLKQ
jgi:hypothetical protein